MLKLKKIAVTGGISSGKTTVCRYLEKQGAYQVSSDDIVHQLLSSDTNCIQEVVKLLGDKILTNNQIDRQKIAGRVFNDPEKLNALEQILHPRVLQEIRRHYKLAKKSKNYILFVAEIPLLFEVNWEKYFDIVLAVICDEKIAMNRAQNDWAERLSRQLSDEEKSKRADYTIINNQDLNALEEQTLKFIRRIRSNGERSISF